jgi:hypothetical protein
MDFLGLRNLTVLDDAVKNIEANRGEKLVLEDLPLDDAESYQLLGTGNTLGVFQLVAYEPAVDAHTLNNHPVIAFFLNAADAIDGARTRNWLDDNQQLLDNVFESLLTSPRGKHPHYLRHIGGIRNGV